MRDAVLLAYVLKQAIKILFSGENSKLPLSEYTDARNSFGELVTGTIMKCWHVLNALDIWQN